MVGHHTYTAISGFGLRVIPRAPYVAVHGPNPGELDVQHNPRGGSRFARVIPNSPGRYRTLIDQRTSSPAEVFTVESGPNSACWSVETSQFRALFPRRFALRSVSPGSTSPFDLVGPGGTLIFAQSPANIPAPGEMRAPGQEVLKEGDRWLEVTYEHDGKQWWQRHEIEGRIVFSAQAPWESIAAARSDLREFLNSVVVP